MNMTNKEMLEKFKAAGAPVEEGMTQEEMKSVWAEFKSGEKEAKANEPVPFVELYKGDRVYKVQPQDVDKCLAQGMTRSK